MSDSKEKNQLKQQCELFKNRKLPNQTTGLVITKIANNCLFMVGSHIAHDCQIDSNVILVNNATLGGHVIIQNNAIVGGNSAVHQFVSIGKYSMIGGMSGVGQDIIPYTLYMGIRSYLRGLNLIGLKRKGLNSKQILILKKTYSIIFNNRDSIINNITKVKNSNCKEIDEIINFINKFNSKTKLVIK